MTKREQTRQRLVDLNNQFPVTQELGVQPVVLERSATNARAFAHTMRLAAFDYPMAFGLGHRRHRINDSIELFDHPSVYTLAVGAGARLLGGAAIAQPTGFFAEQHVPQIAYLFRIREPGNDALKGCGRRVLANAIGNLLCAGRTSVGLDVVSCNRPARDLYESIGFQPISVRSGPNQPFKVLDMLLSGANKMEEAHTKLLAQL